VFPTSSGTSDAFRIALVAYAKSIGAALPSSVQTLGNR
jgi:hypothetical protein